MATAGDLRYILHNRIQPRIRNYVESVRDFEKHIHCCGQANAAQMHEVQGLLNQARVNTDFLERKLRRIIEEIESGR